MPWPCGEWALPGTVGFCYQEEGKREACGAGPHHPTSIHSIMLFLESPSALGWDLLAWPRRRPAFPRIPFSVGF